jgi:membrane-associated protein
VILASPAVNTVALGPSWLDPMQMLESLNGWALVVAVLIVFAECGLLLGFFLPGDSLLFTAGLLIKTGVIQTNIALACLLLTAAAFLGNLTGYYIGYKAGEPLFERPNSRLFRREYVMRTHEFFEKYGGRAIVLARFVPIVRTFITAMAGVARMTFRTYTLYSALGAVLWATGITMLGYLLGRVRFVHDHLTAILLLIVLVSVLPPLVEYLRKRGARGDKTGQNRSGKPGGTTADPGTPTTA